jgi:hypothetical protein
MVVGGWGSNYTQTDIYPSNFNAGWGRLWLGQSLL